MAIYRITVADLISRGQISRYLLKVLRERKSGHQIVQLKAHKAPTSTDSPTLEIDHVTLARLLVIRDLFENLKISRKSMADIYERLEPLFFNHKSVDLTVTKDLFFRIEVAKYLNKAREVLQ